MEDNYDYGTCEECGRKLTEEASKRNTYRHKRNKETSINIFKKII